MIASNVAFLLVAAFAPAPAPAINDANTAAQQLLEAYSTQRNAWSAEYEIATPGEESIFRHISQRNGARFAHAARKALPGSSPDDDPRRQSLAIDGRASLVGRPHEGIVQLDAPHVRGLPGTAPEDVFFFVTGWWCDDTIGPPVSVDSAPLVLADFAHRRLYTTRGRETIDGIDTIVIEATPPANPQSPPSPAPLVDQLWLAEDGRHGVVRRRVRNCTTGQVMQEMRVRAFSETDGRVWPAEIVLHRVGPDGERSRESLMHVRWVAFDDAVPTDHFNVVIPEDTAVYGPDGSLLGVTTETGAFADAIAAWMLRWSSPAVPNPDRASGDDTPRFPAAALIAAAALGVFAERTVTARRSRATAPAQRAT